MLPDFPELKRDLMNAVLREFREAVKSHSGAFADVQRVRYFEGDRHRLDRGEGDVDSSSFEELGATLSLTTDELRELSIRDLRVRMEDWAKEMASQQAKMIYASISEATDRVGNTLEAGRPFDAELLMESLEKIEMDFDPDGTPRWPSLHIHPSNLEDVKRAQAQFDDRPDLQKRMEEIVERKRAEWIAREGRRKLVG